MGRALRRHPVTSKPGRQQRAPTVRTGAPRRGQSQQHSRGIMGILRPKWAEDIISELRKVTWPSREETWNLTWVVVLVAASFGLFLGGVDMFFNWAIDHTLLR